MSSRAVVWVPLGLAAAVGAGVLTGDDAVAVFSIVALLAVVAAARWLWRRERPEGLAVRTWPIDVGVSLGLAVGIVVLALRPGL